MGIYRMRRQGRVFSHLMLLVSQICHTFLTVIQSQFYQFVHIVCVFKSCIQFRCVYAVIQVRHRNGRLLEPLKV